MKISIFLVLFCLVLAQAVDLRHRNDGSSETESEGEPTVSDPVLSKVNIRMLVPPLSIAERLAKADQPPQLLPPTPIPDSEEYPEYYIPPMRNTKPHNFGRDHQRELDVDEQLIERLDVKIMEKRNQVLNHDKWLDSAQRTLDRLDNDITRVETEKTNFENDVDSLKKQKASIKMDAQRQTLEKELQNAADALEALEGQTKDLESTASSLLTTRKSLEERIDEISGQISTADQVAASAANATAPVLAPPAAAPVA